MEKPQGEATQHGFHFQSLTGYFVAHNAMVSDGENTQTKITQEDLGLLPRTYLESETSLATEDTSPSWQSFSAHVKRLNEEAAAGVAYKVIFMTRHGQGFHNVMESKVGTESWESHWALKEGDGTVIWADADLTDKGREQAVQTGCIWAKLLEEQGMPFPVLYVSPMQRCLRTSRIIFQDVARRLNMPYNPLVKEFLRECMGRHTCDRRSTRSWIHEHFPECVFEDGFAEADDLFDPVLRETTEAVISRQQAVLEDIFTNEPSQFVAVTMHSMAGRGMMAAFGHELVKMAPGSTMVFLVKAEKRLCVGGEK